MWNAHVTTFRGYTVRVKITFNVLCFQLKQNDRILLVQLLQVECIMLSHTSVVIWHSEVVYRSIYLRFLLIICKFILQYCNRFVNLYA